MKKDSQSKTVNKIPESSKTGMNNPYYVQYQKKVSPIVVEKPTQYIVKNNYDSTY
ncbi:MAG: hypothetical protein MJ252_16225 [archaeon]|nr:hypothetical protein [archaeon]